MPDLRVRHHVPRVRVAQAPGCALIPGKVDLPPVEYVPGLVRARRPYREHV